MTNNTDTQYKLAADAIEKLRTAASRSKAAREQMREMMKNAIAADEIFTRYDGLIEADGAAGPWYEIDAMLDEILQFDLARDTENAAGAMRYLVRTVRRRVFAPSRFESSSATTNAGNAARTATCLSSIDGESSMMNKMSMSRFTVTGMSLYSTRPC